jgi:hypothetical protein
MQSRIVVKVNYAVRHIGRGFMVVGVDLLPDPLHLQVQEETLNAILD